MLSDTAPSEERNGDEHHDAVPEPGAARRRSERSDAARSEEGTADDLSRTGDPPRTFPGMDPPRHDSGEPVTGSTTDRHRVENKRRREERQQRQVDPPDYWRTHRGRFSVPTPGQSRPPHRGKMCPRGLALHHPAAATLLKYATGGCPAETGEPWTAEQITAAVKRGPHISARSPEAMAYIQEEAKQKARDGRVRIVLWDDIKANLPKEMKVSPLAAIPHKSRAFRAILDLSYSLKLEDGTVIEAVNDTTTKTAPSGACDQLGHCLSRIIHAFATADEQAKIFQAKLDVTDGFWTVVARPGEEWNFCYVLPQDEGEPIRIVVPTSLQMGWVESPPYFCAASETARDVAEQYIETPVGSRPTHKYQHLTEEHADFRLLPETDDEDGFKYLLEVYVDDFIGLAIPASKRQLRHVSNSVMEGFHDVFESDDDEDVDTISVGKIKKGEGHWALEKELLGFDFDGNKHTLWLTAKKRALLLATLHKWVRAARNDRGGIPFDEFESVVQKLRHAFIALPTGKYLLSPMNSVIRARPRVVYLGRNERLLTALQDARVLVRETMAKPTHCAQLVRKWPDYVGVKDASGHGVGGVVIGENMPCTPTVFRLEWPEDVKRNIVSSSNRSGTITNSDLEMAGLFLLWLVMESVCPCLRRRHSALFSDNSPTVGWVRRAAARGSIVAQQLLRALGLRMRVRECPPLTPLHLAGTENAMTDIPSRSFGSNPAWHCRTDADLLKLFNTKFPLPRQKSWTVFRISSALSMRVISVLRTTVFSLEEWRRLPNVGTFTGDIGAPTSHLWEWTLTFRRPRTDSRSGASAASPPESARDTTGSDARSELAQSLRRSQPLARRSPWPSG